jgi:hypothetical protein
MGLIGYRVALRLAREAFQEKTCELIGAIRKSQRKWSVVNAVPDAVVSRVIPFFNFPFDYGQGEQKIWQNHPNFVKCSQNSHQAKECKYNYTKAQFESAKHLHQSTFETFKYLQQTMHWNCLPRWNCCKFAKVKSGPKCCHFFGLLDLFKKILMSLQK